MPSVMAHLDAGADHVAIDVRGDVEQLLATLTQLAGALGLSAKE